MSSKSNSALFGAGIVPAIFAAALIAGAAVSYAKPKEVQDRIPAPSASREAIFQQGVDAYDQGHKSEAFRIWLPLAQQGDLAASRNVALLLRKGDGVPRDSRRALWFYEDAGKKGFLPAQLNAAFMNLEGDGVPIDRKKAAYWFRAAGVHPVAAYNLAVLYEGGEGVAKDMNQARDWYGKAAKAGSPEAAARLELIASNPAELPPPPFLTIPASASPAAETTPPLPPPGLPNAARPGAGS